MSYKSRGWIGRKCPLSPFIPGSPLLCLCCPHLYPASGVRALYSACLMARRLYPPDTNAPSGKARLLYEVAPMSFLAEQAGGVACVGPLAGRGHALASRDCDFDSSLSYSMMGRDFRGCLYLEGGHEG